MGTLVTTASCSRSNSAFHCKSLSSKTESEVSSISLLTFYSPAMVLLHVSTTYVSYTLYVISSKVSSSMLSTGFSSIYVSEFVSTYALTTKHMMWLNIEIFCFKLLHHIKSDPFRSLSFLFMNHQYTAALGCMLLKDVTKYLFVVQTNSHIFTIFSPTDLLATNKQFGCLYHSWQVASTPKIWCNGVRDMMSSTILWSCTCLFSVPLYFYSERKRDS